MKTDHKTPDESLVAYHRRRAASHQEMAAAATDVGVRKVHQQLADRHAALANGDKADLRVVRDV